MASARARAIRFTVQDYLALPETGPQYQLVDGDLITSPAPNRFHQDISRNIEFALLKYLEEHPVGRLYHAPFDVFLTEFDVFQPDIIFVKQDRMSIFTDAGAEGAPSLVVEVLSPRTVQLDRHTKRKIYARTGVEEFWLVDPELRSVEVYHLDLNPEEATAVYDGDQILSSPLFPGWELPLEGIFRR